MMHVAGNIVKAVSKLDRSVHSELFHKLNTDFIPPSLWIDVLQVVLKAEEQFFFKVIKQRNNILTKKALRLD